MKVTSEHATQLLKNTIEKTKQVYGQSFMDKEPYELKTVIPFFVYRILFEGTKIFTILNLPFKAARGIVYLMNRAYHVGMLEATVYMNTYGSTENLEELPAAED